MLQVIQTVSTKGEGEHRYCPFRISRRTTDGLRLDTGRSKHLPPARRNEWTAFVLRSQLNASLSGFRPERGNLSRRPPFAAYAARGRLSSRTRKLVETATICRLRRPWTAFIPNAETCPRRPFLTRWTVFAPRDRINAPLSGFRPKHGNSSVSAVIRCLRTISPPPPRNPAETHFFRNEKFTDRRIAPVSSVTRIHLPIKEKTPKNAFLQNH